MTLFSSPYFEPTPYSPYYSEYLNLREQDLKPLYLLDLLYLLQLHLLQLHLLQLYLLQLHLL
jgi:hypothetical protein